ncbi:hypothetical protein KP803_21740 [Vibrio sp. ZSDE26]|uniref:Uncharacterized protein n=1 Tax=Vibrio amylolyticus TaxID=2847292 RepID=A0A9X2BNG0_9VIBR|nr:hypothetical protein [Vibrio amylolyticus]MCK6265883.1 hypothetical protein [Vibrio amylolyticus]
MNIRQIFKACALLVLALSWAAPIQAAMPDIAPFWHEEGPGGNPGLGDDSNDDDSSGEDSDGHPNSKRPFENG